jgi:hypothetical protein
MHVHNDNNNNDDDNDDDDANRIEITEEDLEKLAAFPSIRPYKEHPKMKDMIGELRELKPADKMQYLLRHMKETEKMYRDDAKFEEAFKIVHAAGIALQDEHGEDSPPDHDHEEHEEHEEDGKGMLSGSGSGSATATATGKKTSGAKGGRPTFGHSEMSKSYPENVRMRWKGRTGITSRRSEKTMKKRSMMSPGPGWMSALDVAVIAHKQSSLQSSMQSYLQSSHESNHMCKHQPVGFTTFGRSILSEVTSIPVLGGGAARKYGHGLHHATSMTTSKQQRLARGKRDAPPFVSIHSLHLERLPPKKE